MSSRTENVRISSKATNFKVTYRSVIHSDKHFYLSLYRDASIIVKTIKSIDTVLFSHMDVFGIEALKSEWDIFNK